MATAEEAFKEFLEVSGLKDVPRIYTTSDGRTYEFDVDHPKVGIFTDYHSYWTEVAFDTDGNLIKISVR